MDVLINGNHTKSQNLVVEHVSMELYGEHVVDYSAAGMSCKKVSTPLISLYFAKKIAKMCQYLYVLQTWKF